MPRDFASRNSMSLEISTYAGDAQENFNYGLKQFLEEARTLAKFQQHSGIVSVQNFFKENGTGYMVMEYVDGLTLKDYLSKKGKLSWHQTFKLFMPVMDALREVHKHKMLHRDISPDNIYLCRDNQIKLLDFGSARYAMGGHSQSLSVVIKPGYAPEEQYRSKGKQGAWTDVYSVAASMYRCVTGIVPPEALDRLDEDELVKPSSLGVDISTRTENGLLSGLTVKAADRVQSIESFQHILTIKEQQREPVDISDEELIALKKNLKEKKEERITTEKNVEQQLDYLVDNLNQKSKERPVISMKNIIRYSILLMFFGILASIAIPAYEDYITRATLEKDAYQTVGLNASQLVTSYYSEHRRLPSDLKQAGYTKLLPTSIKAVGIGSQKGVISIRMASPTLKDKTLLFIPSLDINKQIIWKCKSKDIEGRYLPQQCLHQSEIDQANLFYTQGNYEQAPRYFSLAKLRSYWL